MTLLRPPQSAGISFVVVTAADPLWVDADPQRLQQVLANLLRNAVMCTDPGGRISLAAERDGATVTIRVSDTGRGIEQDALTKIFELFSQTPGPRDRWARDRTERRAGNRNPSRWKD